MCPPWALKDLHKYHVSVVGKITSIDKENDSMELLLDPKCICVVMKKEQLLKLLSTSLISNICSEKQMFRN